MMLRVLRSPCRSIQNQTASVEKSRKSVRRIFTLRFEISSIQAADSVTTEGKRLPAASSILSTNDNEHQP